MKYLSGALLALALGLGSIGYASETTAAAVDKKPCTCEKTCKHECSKENHKKCKCECGCKEGNCSHGLCHSEKAETK